MSPQIRHAEPDAHAAAVRVVDAWWGVLGGDAVREGVPCTIDYDGPGGARVRLRRAL